jgi:hypothetical protein
MTPLATLLVLHPPAATPSPAWPPVAWSRGSGRVGWVRCSPR